MTDDRAAADSATAHPVAPEPSPAEARVARRAKERARELGFDAVGIAAVGPLEARQHYDAWLAAGRHGDMAWLATERSRARRADASRILPNLRAVICVAMCHEPARDPDRDRRLGRIARYALGEDYHRVMRDRLRELVAFLREELPGSRPLWYADTGAILERGWAERAGIGWTGKHSGLISPRLGSWFLLGEVLVDRPLAADPPFEGAHCGRCARCLEICPTGAILAPGEVDARLCLSYLTIEHRGPIPRALRPAIGDWIFGCDLCQEVCPWNRFAPPAREARLHARELEGWTLEKFLELDDEGFARLFEGSPIRRAQRGGFLRNVCVALGNRAEAAAVPALTRALADDPEPLVRGHAAWALGEIGSKLGAEGAACTVEDVAGSLTRAAAADPSPDVREEALEALARLEP